MWDEPTVQQNVAFIKNVLRGFILKIEADYYLEVAVDITQHSDSLREQSIVTISISCFIS